MSEHRVVGASASKGRPGPVLTHGLSVVLAVAVGYWIIPKLRGVGGRRAETAPAAASLVTPLLKGTDNVAGAVAPTDSGPMTFRVAGDPWSGYSTFRGEPRFTAALAKHGLSISYLDEEKYYDQDERMRALAAGDIDIAVTTLDAFLQHGANHLVNGKYPGVVLFGIDESAGGDAIFLQRGKGSFDDVVQSDKVCYAKATPSEHLWDFASLSFARLGDLAADTGVVAKDCWEKLLNKQVQVAVLWQPYTAIAERAGYRKVFATGGQADDVILDVMVVGREVLNKHKAALTQLTDAYFRTIDSYTRDRAAHGEFIRADCGQDCAGDPSLGEAVIDGIDFLTFEENLCLWFGQCGVPNKVLPRVGKTGRLLIAKGKLRAEQLPAPTSIIDDSALLAIKQERVSAAKLAAEVSGPNTAVDIPMFTVREPTYAYTVPGAEGTSNVGTLRLPNVLFRDGAYVLDDDAKTTVADIAERLRSFPALCVRITGYTSSAGSAQANRQLSQYRAGAIAVELNRVDPKAFPMTRFELHGLASSAPVVINGHEDVRASRRTEFVVFNCKVTK